MSITDCNKWKQKEGHKMWPRTCPGCFPGKCKYYDEVFVGANSPAQSELVARLKRYSPPEGVNEVMRGVARDIQEAADRIIALEAENADLRKTLSLFGEEG